MDIDHRSITTVSQRHQRVPKRVSFFSVTNTMRPFRHLSCTDFDHATTDVNRCVRAHTCEKFPNFCTGILQAPKNCLWKWYFWYGAWFQHTAQTAQFWAIEIISGASWHPKDMPFVRQFLWGMYGLGTITSKKTWHFIVNTTLCLLTSGSRKILFKSGSWISRLSK